MTRSCSRARKCHAGECLGDNLKVMLVAEQFRTPRNRASRRNLTRSLISPRSLQDSCLPKLIIRDDVLRDGVQSNANRDILMLPVIMKVPGVKAGTGIIDVICQFFVEID